MAQCGLGNEFSSALGIVTLVRSSRRSSRNRRKKSRDDGYGLRVGARRRAEETVSDVRCGRSVEDARRKYGRSVEEVWREWRAEGGQLGDAFFVFFSKMSNNVLQYSDSISTVTIIQISQKLSSRTELQNSAELQKQAEVGLLGDSKKARHHYTVHPRTCIKCHRMCP